MQQADTHRVPAPRLRIHAVPPRKALLPAHPPHPRHGLPPAHHAPRAARLPALPPLRPRDAQAEGGAREGGADEETVSPPGAWGSFRYKFNIMERVSCIAEHPPRVCRLLSEPRPSAPNRPRRDLRASEPRGVDGLVCRRQVYPPGPRTRAGPDVFCRLWCVISLRPRPFCPSFWRADVDYPWKYSLTGDLELRLFREGA